MLRSSFMLRPPLPTTPAHVASKIGSSALQAVTKKESAGSGDPVAVSATPWLVTRGISNHPETQRQSTESVIQEQLVHMSKPAIDLHWQNVRDQALQLLENASQAARVPSPWGDESAFLPPILPKVDHLAVRQVLMGNPTDFRKEETSHFSSHGLRVAARLNFSASKNTEIWGHGQGQMAKADYDQMVRGDGAKTLASVFSTVYTVQDIPNIPPKVSEAIAACMTDPKQIEDPKTFLTIVECPQVPTEVKAVLALQANGHVNHLAFVTPDIDAGSKLLTEFSVGNTLNERQIGQRLQQVSNWPKGGDFIELVYRPPIDGQVFPHSFQLKNTEPLFRSTQLGLLEKYAEVKGFLPPIKDLHRIFPDGQIAINFFATNGMLETIQPKAAVNL